MSAAAAGGCGAFLHERRGSLGHSHAWVRSNRRRQLSSERSFNNDSRLACVSSPRIAKGQEGRGSPNGHRKTSSRTVSLIVDDWDCEAIGWTFGFLGAQVSRVPQADRVRSHRAARVVGAAIAAGQRNRLAPPPRLGAAGKTSGESKPGSCADTNSSLLSRLRSDCGNARSFGVTHPLARAICDRTAALPVHSAIRCFFFRRMTYPLTPTHKPTKSTPYVAGSGAGVIS